MALTPEQQALDYNPELQDVSRQRKLAELLMAQGMQQPQGQMISGHYVAPSWSQQMNPMANILAGQAIGNRADTEQVKIAEALRGKQMEVAQQYAQAKTPQERMAAAMNPNAPKMIQAAYAERIKPQKVGKGEAIYYEDSSSPAYQGAPDLPHGYNAAAWEQGVDLNTLPVGQRSGVANRAGEINRILHPGTNVYNNMPPAESEYSKVTGGLIAKRDDALKDAAENAQLSIDNIARQRTVLKSDKVITGFGAEPRLALAQFGQAIGAGGKDSNELVSNTQGLLASRASATLDAIKTSNLGSAQGFSNTDREFLEKAKLGGIKYTAESLNHQLDIEEKLARFSVDKYNNRLKQLPKSASGPLNLQPITLTSPSNVVDYNSLK